MGDTSLPVDGTTVDRARKYRHDEHDSWDETFNAILDRIPSIGDIYEDGCANCGETPPRGHPPEEWGTIAESFRHDAGQETLPVANYYCSRECVAEMEERRQTLIPDEPDKVVVGGKDELRTTISGARFHLDGTQMEVNLDVPGAFCGEDDFGNEYAYEGEPVYVYHDGACRHRGIIETIQNQETHTGIILERDYTETMLYHPNEAKRGEYVKEHGLPPGMSAEDVGVDPSIVPDEEDQHHASEEGGDA